MLGSLRVKPESSYQQPIDPPPGSDSTAAAGEKTGFGRTGSSLSQNDSAFFFTRRSLRCHDTERGGKSLL